MHILNFIFSSLSFLLLLFSVHLFFAKLGNRLLNRLLSVLLFARVGQIIIYILVSSNEQVFVPVIQQLFIPFYFAAPACFYLYITSFINGRSSFRKYDLLHGIPVVLAIIHVLPWFSSPSIIGNTITTQIVENKQLLITERAGLFPSYLFSVGSTVLVLGYLAAAWYAVLTSQVIRKKSWDVNKIWIFFCLIVAAFIKLVSTLPLIFSSLILPHYSSIWFVSINCGIVLFIIVFLLQQPRILYGYLFVDVKWVMKDVDTEKTPPPSKSIAKQK